jgi:hypothetical protein
MSMLCPQCGNTYEQRLECDLCAVRLIFHDPRRGRARRFGGGARWRQTTWGRILIGVLLAQGLFYGLRQLLTGALLAFGPEAGPAGLWDSETGQLLYHCLRFVTLVAGAALAGAGQGQGMVLGAVVGVWCGLLSAAIRPAGAPDLTSFDLYAQPLVQTVIGFLAGWVGCIFWRPLPAIDPRTGTSGVKRAGRPSLLFAGRVAWLRVTLGVCLAVAGSLTAAKLFDLTLDVADGKLVTSDEVQDQVVMWEIKALALMLGGFLAGATRRNGLKQGLAVGIGTTVVMVGIIMARFDRWAALAGWTALSALTLCLSGGYFGSQLFPPVVKFRRLRDFGPV